MANHSIIPATRTPWQYEKAEIYDWKMSTHNSRKNEVAGLKWKWHRVVDMSGGENKV